MFKQFWNLYWNYIWFFYFYIYYSNIIVFFSNLQSTTQVCTFSHSVQNQVYDFFSNCVVASGIIISRIFFTGYQLFRMKQMAVGSSTNFIWKTMVYRPPILIQNQQNIVNVIRLTIWNSINYLIVLII